jgi:hypothetical protein
MKFQYLPFLLALLIGIGTGCKKGADYQDKLYFTGTEQSPEVRFTVDGPSDVGISVTSSARVTKDIKVSIKVDPSLLDSYNKLQGTAYQLLPEGSYALPVNSITIKAGSTTSESAKFSVLSLDNFKEGVTYCVPVTIVGVDADMPVLNASRTEYLIINRTIITQAAVLSPNYFTVAKFQTEASLASVPKLTMECRVLVNQFTTANPFISSLIGIEENYLLRFGDVSIANNQLQLAGGKVGDKKYPVTSKAFFATSQWYHIAVVYDGARNNVYVNGVLDNYTDAQAAGVNLTDSYSGGFHIGFSADGRLLNGYVSEARVWTRALTAKELQNNLCYVDPTSKDLLAYWRFNGADQAGTGITDLTGHGYTAVASRAISWVPGVRCPN